MLILHISYFIHEDLRVYSQRLQQIKVTFSKNKSTLDI